MEVIPAIDLLGGKVVRLAEGRRESAVVYRDDPAEVLDELAAGGARRVHLVDLDGAFDGPPGQAALLARLIARARVPLQIGGGLRTAEAVAHLVALGADRVVLGTAVAEDAALLASLCARHPGRIVVAVDGRDGRVLTRGWTAASDRSVVDLAREAASVGAAAVLYTDVRRDGLGVGPNVEATAALQRAVQIPVIASGGVGSVAHLHELRAAGIQECVLGRALYEGKVTLAEALACA